MIEDTVGVPNPPVLTPTDSIFIESGPAKWSKGNDVRRPTLSFVYGPPPVDDGLVGVDDLMGGGSFTHSAALPIF
jgi:hypothetical protein